MEKQCRVCLVKGSQYERIESILKDLFDTLLIPVDKTSHQEQIVCKECVKKLYELFDFKTLCLYTEDALLPFIKDGQLNLRLLYSVSESLRSSEIEKEAEICRLCLDVTAKSVPLETAMSQNGIQDVFRNHLPEISLQSVERPSVCKNCVRWLHILKKFTSNSTRNEGKEESTQSKKRLRMRKTKLMRSDTNFDIESEPTIVDQDTALNLLRKFCKSTPQSKMVQCYKCSYETEHDVALEQHLESHLPKIMTRTPRYYKCPTEDCQFFSRPDRHIIAAHKKTHEKKISCAICGEICEGYLMYTRHRHLRHISDGTYKCDKCPFTETKRGKFERHVAWHRDYWIRCDDCSFKTKNEVNLMHHRNKYHDYQMYYCHNCSYSSKIKQCLRVHMLVHMSDKKAVWYRCDICSFRTKYTTSLQKHHLRVHIEDRFMHDCRHCDRKFYVQYERNMHELLIHETDDEKRREFIKKCPSCPYETWRVGHMKKHMVNVHSKGSKRKLRRRIGEAVVAKKENGEK